MNKTRLIIECAVLFGILPTLMLFAGPKLIFAGLWALLVIAAVVLYRDKMLNDIWKPQAVTWANLKPMLLRFIPLALFLAGFTYAYNPDRLFGFVSHAPERWALVMLLYPILSALPQELIYRSFFFHRYKELFSCPTTLLLVNALLFGYAHILFKNPIAVTFTIIGGWLFAQTYHKTKSLWLATIEHALYGNFIFTIGLGWYFYNGAVS